MRTGKKYWLYLNERGKKMEGKNENGSERKIQSKINRIIKYFMIIDKIKTIENLEILYKVDVLFFSKQNINLIKKKKTKAKRTKQKQNKKINKYNS